MSSANSDQIMVKTRKGKFGIPLAIFGALLLAFWFIAGPKFRSAPEPTADEDTGDSVPKVEEPAVSQSAPVAGEPPAEPEAVGPPPLKTTTLLQRVSRKTESGEVVVVLEAGDKVDVVAVRGTRIYVRTPVGETIGIPVTATDWVIQEDEYIDR
jgi:hypothetical protein